MNRGQPVNVIHVINIVNYGATNQAEAESFDLGSKRGRRQGKEDNIRLPGMNYATPEAQSGHMTRRSGAKHAG